MKKYFIVRCKCGHVGKNKYILIDFPVCAYSGSEAAFKVRYMPRVKHNKKYAIVSVTKVSFKEYIIQREINDNDPYLKSHSKQEQNLKCTNLYKRINYRTDNSKIKSKEEIKEERDKKISMILNKQNETSKFYSLSNIDCCL